MSALLARIRLPAAARVCAPALARPASTVAGRRHDDIVAPEEHPYAPRQRIEASAWTKLNQSENDAWRMRSAVLDAVPDACGL